MVPNVEIRKSNERGLAEHGWLKSRHTFSFADYRDPKHMGFRSLRVINEDRIQGGTGFGAHPHRDMEIISYVVKGSLKHSDSMGTNAIIRPGEVQRMSAGSGIKHAEMNNEAREETHFFQIWIMPKSGGGTPGYGQKSFESELASKKLVLVVSNDGREGSISIQQDADLYISRLKSAESFEFTRRAGRGLWVQVVKGDVILRAKDESRLQTGDAAAVDDNGTKSNETITIKATEDSELMLFDLA